jgi:hypothetical protein
MTRQAMNGTAFWAAVNQQLSETSHAKTVNDVLRIFSAERNPYGADFDGMAGDAFFAGSGGDKTLFGALTEAGWRVIMRKAPYFWAMTSPDGEKLTYIEGDIYRGVR